MSKKVKNISVISTGSWVPPDLNNEYKVAQTYKVQIEKLMLDASIGIHDHEKQKKQKISISLSIKVNDNIADVDEDINNFVSYENVINNIKLIINEKSSNSSLFPLHTKVDERGVSRKTV